jgi:hypothetical protein
VKPRALTLTSAWSLAARAFRRQGARHRAGWSRAQASNFTGSSNAPVSAVSTSVCARRSVAVPTARRLTCALKAQVAAASATSPAQPTLIARREKRASAPVGLHQEKSRRGTSFRNVLSPPVWWTRIAIRGFAHSRETSAVRPFVSTAWKPQEAAHPTRNARAAGAHSTSTNRRFSARPSPNASEDPPAAAQLVFPDFGRMTVSSWKPGPIDAFIVGKRDGPVLLG